MRVRKTPGILTITEGGFSLRWWGMLVFIFGSLAFYAIWQKRTAMTDFTPLWIVGCFWIAGLFSMLFARYTMAYTFNKKNDTVTFVRPELMGFLKTTETFCLSDMDSISKVFETQTSEESHTYESASCVIHLKNKQTVDAGFFSSDHREIDDLVAAISDFCGIPIRPA